MNQLYRKYIHNTLSRDELVVLRNSANGAEPGLEELMQSEWFDDHTSCLQVSDEAMLKARKRLDRTIHQQKPHISLTIKIMAWAAGILLPLFLLSTLYLYKENQVAKTSQMVVSTAQGERATITLPDGTIVTLNSDSKLTYAPSSYNKKMRQINFSGEAYFEVFNDQCKLFKINSRGLSVEVLGTSFNLSVRDEEKTASLYLTSGSVLFTSLQRNQSVILRPEQEVVMNQSTGAITVNAVQDRTSIAWRDKEMVFRNASLQSVLEIIKKTYQVEFSTIPHIEEYYFTGTLVTNNLNGVLEVLERSFHLKASLADGKIVLTRK